MPTAPVGSPLICFRPTHRRLDHRLIECRAEHRPDQLLPLELFRPRIPPMNREGLSISSGHKRRSGEAPTLLELIALGDFRRRLYSKHVMDTGHQDIEESGVATAPHPQNVQSGSIVAQLDLAITFSETALSASDRESARRSMAFVSQLLDGVERSLDEGLLDCSASAEIESRLDWLRLLFRGHKEANWQQEDKAIDTCPLSKGAAGEPGVERLTEDEPMVAAPEVLASEDVRRDPTESLNCRSHTMQPPPLRERTAWQSLRIRVLDKFSAWLMTRVSYRLVLRAPWPNLYRWLGSSGTRKRAPATASSRGIAPHRG
jgi:hypothetical protein